MELKASRWCDDQESKARCVSKASMFVGCLPSIKSKLLADNYLKGGNVEFAGVFVRIDNNH